MKACPPEGLRVCFRPNPAARAVYGGDGPAMGECGTVKSVSLGRGRRTCMPGPVGGLVYVDWDRSRFQGVFRKHLYRESTGKPLGGRKLRRSR